MDKKSEKSNDAQTAGTIGGRAATIGPIKRDLNGEPIAEEDASPGAAIDRKQAEEQGRS